MYMYRRAEILAMFLLELPIWDLEIGCTKKICIYLHECMTFFFSGFLCYQFSLCLNVYVGIKNSNLEVTIILRKLEKVMKLKDNLKIRYICHFEVWIWSYCTTLCFALKMEKYRGEITNKSIVAQLPQN